MAVKRSSNVLIAAATLIGTSIESYDFIVYGYAAALVFPALFFPKADAFAGQIASYAIFWLGFLGRPLGGVIFGHFGDRLGRKAMLVTTLSIMGVATFLVGLLPTYDRIGFWAPVLLVTLRLFQGVAAGGEFGGAVLLAAEHAQENRRGLLSSYPQMGVPFGLVLASLAFIAVIAPHAANGNVSLMGNAWRYPFLFSIVLVAIGLAIRWRITESPAFERAKAQAKIVAAPVLAVLRANWKEVLLTGGAFVAISAGFYLVTTQIFSYGAGPQSVLKLDARVFFIANLVGSMVSLFVMPFGGWLSDRIGRRPVYMAAVAIIVLVAFPMYALIDTKSLLWITVAICCYTVPASLAFGSFGAMLGEQFGTNVRYSGVSLGYNAAALLGGGVTPLLATVLLKISGGESWVLAMYLAGLAAISLVSTFVLEERRDFARSM